MTSKSAGIALVTGGSRGLGRNIAVQLARSSVDVVVTYRARRDEGEAAVAEISALGRTATALELDVANCASFAAFGRSLVEVLQSHWGRGDFDFLINNAGIDRAAPFAELSEQDFDDLVDVHFKGVFS